MNTINRRLLLKSTATVAASYLTSPIWASPNHYDVIVVGAGLSGLHNCYLLEQLGLNVLLLEGSDRVGGRIHTLDHIEGHPEAGANQIGMDYDILRSIISRNNIELGAGAGMAPGMAFSINQQLFPAREWSKHPANHLSEDERNNQPNWLLWQYLNKGETLNAPEDWLLPGFTHLDIPLADHLKNLGASDEALRLMNSNFSGDDIYRISALQMLRKNAVIKGARGSEFIDAGTQRLPEAMAASLKNPPLFNKAVNTISQHNNLLTIKCSDGSSYQTKRCVMAAPFSTVRHMDLQVHLSDAKRQAIKGLHYSHTSHVFLKPKVEYWEEDKLSPNMWTDSPAGMVFSQQDKDKKITLIRAWLMGNNAKTLDHLSTKEIGQQVLQQLETIRPAAKGKLEVIEAISWHQNPFSRGAFAQFQAGDINRFAYAVAKPEGLMHFVGEHTEYRKSGMEAAVLSAERCATEMKQVIS